MAGISIKIDLTNVMKLDRNMTLLLNKFPIEADKALVEWGKWIRKSAKLRAPRWTGKLAAGIRLEHTKQGQIKIVSRAHQARLQEEGYQAHFVSVRKHPQLLAWQMAKYGIAKANPAGMFYVRKFKPHIIPAIEASRVKLPQIIDRHLKSAFRKSGFKGG